MVKDSLPHTNIVYFDGQNIGQSNDTLEGAASASYDDKFHTYTVVVTDAKGTFQKSSSFRQSRGLPCAAPTSDRSLNCCIPAAGEITTSPLRVAAVASSSIGISWVQVWVDGVKYSTAHLSGTANQKIMNDHVYLANGTHQVSIVAKEADGTSTRNGKRSGSYPNRNESQVTAGPLESEFSLSGPSVTNKTDLRGPFWASSMRYADTPKREKLPGVGIPRLQRHSSFGRDAGADGALFRQLLSRRRRAQRVGQAILVSIGLLGKFSWPERN